MILDISAKGIPENSRRVHGMADRAGDARPLWRHVAPVIVDAERRRFLRGFTKKATGGSRTVSRRRYSLVDSGRLRRSLTKRSLTATGGADTIFELDRDEMEFGTTVFYARFLRKRGFKLIDLDRRARGDIQDHVRHFLIGGTR